MSQLDIILGLHLACLGLFGLNGILWMALRNKHNELKIIEERVLRLLLATKIRRR